jgi:hypothetical protein
MIKRIFGVTALAAGIGLAAGDAGAVEALVPHLAGVNGGGATGTVLPDGVYGINTAAYVTGPSFDTAGNKTPTDVEALVEIPEIYWSTGLNILGAKYAVAIAEPWDFAGISGVTSDTGGFAAGAAFATVISPGILSWDLPNNLHLNARLDVYIPNGAYRNPINHPFGNGVAIDFFSFEPAVALTWLSDGWNVSLKAYADINTKDQDIDYTSGTVFGTEETITKGFGKWTFGLQGFTQNQLNNDTGAAVALVNGPQAALDGHRLTDYGIGPYVGYNFGPVALALWTESQFATVNDTGGLEVFTKITVPF